MGKQARTWTHRILISRRLGFIFLRVFFLGIWADFLRILSRTFSHFCSILVPIFGSQKWTHKWASDSGFNRILIVGAKAGPIFGSVFGTHFWAPVLVFFYVFFETLACFFWCLELAGRLLRTCNRPKLLSPLVAHSLYSLIWGRPGWCWGTCFGIARKAGSRSQQQHGIALLYESLPGEAMPWSAACG